MRRRAPGRAGRAAIALPCALLALTACTGGSGATPSPPPSPPPATRTIVETVPATSTPTPRTSFTPEPDASVHPLPPGQSPRAGEKEQRCPYIRTGLQLDPTSDPNVADIEGDRILRNTVLTKLTPVGCRFYFYAPPYEAVADILPQTFATATAARNALVLTARAGRNAQSYPGFVKGVDGINYQTRFFGPDGNTDWAFAFAKGRVLVVVHTQQNDSPLNALYLARAIAEKF